MQEKLHAKTGVSVGEVCACAVCSRPIMWMGTYWEHIETNPRHPGQPRIAPFGNSRASLALSYGEPRERRGAPVYGAK